MGKTPHVSKVDSLQLKVGDLISIDEYIQGIDRTICLIIGLEGSFIIVWHLNNCPKYPKYYYQKACMVADSIELIARG